MSDKANLEGWSVGFDSGYREPKSVQEIAEGLSNLLLVNLQLRPFSYHTACFQR